MKLNHSFFFVIFFTILLLNSCGIQHRNALRDHGKEAIGTVLEKNATVAIRANNKHQYIRVGFFADTSTDESPTQSVLSDTSLTMSERLDKWQPSASLGTYMTVQITVQSVSSKNLAPGDKVKIVYLPEDPTVAMLRSELHD